MGGPQKVLLQIEERILEYRDESQLLDQCNILYDSSVFNNAFELNASYIVNYGKTKNDSTRAHDMLRNTEVAVGSFMMLRPRFLHQNQGATSTQTSGGSQAAVNAMVQVYDFYSGLPKKPSPFLQQTVTRFEKYLSECLEWIEELEQLLLIGSERNSLTTSSSLLQSLPKVLDKSKVESIHQSMRAAYERCRGEENDPFLEADRREMTKQEAAAQWAHPTQHFPLAPVGPSTSVNISAALSALSTPLFSTPTSTSAPFSSLLGTSQSSLSTFLSTSASQFGGSTPLFGSTPAFGVSTFSTPFATGSGASFGTLSKARAKSRPGRGICIAYMCIWFLSILMLWTEPCRGEWSEPLWSTSSFGALHVSRVKTWGGTKVLEFVIEDTNIMSTDMYPLWWLCVINGVWFQSRVVGSWECKPIVGTNKEC
ncbi:hydroxyproline-rich glycoprotein family protein [Striga asiatica]|uniref:Hydroxyproline-rich glycoprotein family protein n=1 Tax=Striga asiatica TaxID=4170 RepID=A0A5A7PAC0_STRAF|nr:hydroxyproline-rich glycoprotein family protein [Striga asiatica]